MTNWRAPELVCRPVEVDRYSSLNNQNRGPRTAGCESQRPAFRNDLHSAQIGIPHRSAFRKDRHSARIWRGGCSRGDCLHAAIA